VTETSRLDTTACALASALDALGDALARADAAAIAGSESALGACVGTFRRAAADALGSGATLTPAALAAVTSALSRCRRLGLSLTLLTGTSPAPCDAPQAYTPVGLPLLAPDGGAFLTARG
jgi:hypothetical protein